MAEVPGSEKIYEADLILLAMGFMGPEQAVLEQLKVAKDPRSNIQTPINNYKSSVAKVYAAGGKLIRLYLHIFSTSIQILQIVVAANLWLSGPCTRADRLLAKSTWISWEKRRWQDQEASLPCPLRNKTDILHIEFSHTCFDGY